MPRRTIGVNDLDVIEVNEAFASQSIQVRREMGWDMDKVNVNGGAIAIGHPVGASGARILVTLIYEMVRRDASLGPCVTVHRRRTGHRDDNREGEINQNQGRTTCPPLRFCMGRLFCRP